MHPLRGTVLAAAGNDRLKRALTAAPVSRAVVRRFVAGESTKDAVAARAYAEPAGVAFADRHEVDLSYARCSPVADPLRRRPR